MASICALVLGVVTGLRYRFSLGWSGQRRATSCTTWSSERAVEASGVFVPARGGETIGEVGRPPLVRPLGRMPVAIPDDIAVRFELAENRTVPDHVLRRLAADPAPAVRAAAEEQLER